MKYISMSNSEDKSAIIDDDDFEYLSKFIWTLTSDGYAKRSKRRKETNSKNLTMHRIIVECPDSMVVDHINFNKLDNRKENLRIVTREQNSSHQPPYKRVQPISSKKIQKLHPYNRMLTKEETNLLDIYLQEIRIMQS